MSSTNRGRDREKSDYYITPIEEIEKFLVEFDKICPLKGKYILDPSAGGDKHNPMSYFEALEPYETNLLTLDIREDSRAEYKCDYLKLDVQHKPEIIMTNPPFSLSVPFIIKALDDVQYGGYVVMLNRLNFFGSKARQPLFKEYMPLYCFAHSKRMSFTKDGKSDSIEYAHFVWQRGVSPEYTRLKVLDYD